MQSRKNVLVYSEYWSSFGGGEKYLLCCVESLLRSGEYDVNIVARSGSFDRDTLSRYFNVDVHDARVHLVDGSWSAVRRKAIRMSGRADLCIYMTNFPFFPSLSRQTIAVLQIPYGRISTGRILSRAAAGEFRESIKDFYRRQLLTRLRSSHHVLVYSQYVRDSLASIHRVPANVLEPAIDDFHMDGIPKEHIILSVGRFFRGLYNDKRYDILIESFKRLCARLPHTTWHYRLAGSCGKDGRSQQYLAELMRAAQGYPIYFSVNVPFDELKRHYNTATLFWHAAGYGVDEEKHPERAEHFGMSTVEAMSAGCVPVVVRKGGQKEIVSHGESGYLWDTVDELVGNSLQLIQDQRLLERLRSAARKRAGMFGRERFASRFLSYVQQLDSNH
jgi:glycosyltransferase involved in cell wall biosynthesis